MKVWALLGVVSAWLVASCGGAAAPTEGGRVAIDVAALGLAGVDNVTYTISVTNESGERVWSRQLDADGYGDGAGSLSYVGACDADDDPNGDGDAVNVVGLTVDAVVAGGVTLTAGVDYANPAPSGSPLTRDVACLADADVAVQLDLTLARRATQGFFDVAVSFEDAFCSAKLDCVDDDGDPLELLHVPGGGRGRTVVAALACTGGLGSDTWLYADALTLDCGAAGSVDLAPTEPAGNHGAVAPWVFQHAVYFGAEQLASGATSYGKSYWNVAVGLDEAALPTTSACALSWAATASSSRFDVGAAPAGTTWPVIAWSVPVTSLGSGAVTCGRHPLYGDDVTVGYAEGLVWPYEMYGDVLAGGAGAFARESGANVGAPAWASAPDLGALSYGATVDVMLSAPDTDPGATVTFTSADLPSWLSLTTDGHLTGGTLDEAELGPVSFTVVASDGLHDAPRTFTLLARHAAHCEAIRQAQPTLSGLSVHVVDPVGDGADPFDVLCDMTSWGGGWTLIAAQFESDPVAWDEGRQADYDPTLASGAGFALAGADLVAHDQLAFGSVESTGAGTWDRATIDYVDHVYDPSADYAAVAVTGLATPHSYQIDRHTSGHHNNHNPESTGVGSTVDWDDTLSIDRVGGRYFTWSFSPNQDTIPSYRGFGMNGVFHTGSDAFAWGLWARLGAAHTAPPPTAAPASCDAIKTASPGLSGVGIYTITTPGGAPLDVLCDMSTWGGGWTLVVAQHESTPVSWGGGASPSTYAPSLSPTADQAFTLAAGQVPPHSQTAFGIARSSAPRVWVTQWLDYVSFVYPPSAATHPAVTVSGLATAKSYQIHRHPTVYYAAHNPEENTGSTAVWNDTLTFDETGGRGFTWAFSPNQTTPASRGYAYGGTALSGNDDTLWFWAVWVR